MLEFNLPSTSNQTFNLADLKQPLILFFYPRDNTPGCIIENIEFSALYPQFQELGYEVLGISRDSVKKHCGFINKQNLTVNLLADEEEIVCNLFEVMKDKNMYGKKVRGIERSTFVISKDKKIIKEWRKVNVEGHAQIVLDYIKSIAN